MPLLAFNLFHWFQNEVSLKHIELLMSSWGYPILFILLFSCGLGVPLPEDIPLILAGYFIANGKMNLLAAAICAWCGIIGGDCMLYSFGRRYGLGITKLPLIGHHVTAKRIQYAERLFQRYGPWVVGVGRMVAGVRGAMVVAAGTIRFNLFRFLVADGLGAVVSGGLFMALGYWAGTQLGDLEALREKVHHYEMRVLILILIATIGLMIFVWRRHTRRKPVVDKALETVVKKAEDSVDIRLRKATAKNGDAK